MSLLALASTPLAALLCAGAAYGQKQSAELVLIEDFDNIQAIQTLFESWPGSPFSAIHCLPGRHTERQRGVLEQTTQRRGLGSLIHRAKTKASIHRNNLAELDKVLKRLQPTQVWLCNDRKVETQYVLDQVQTRTGEPSGHYLDDGLYTYLGDVRQRPLTRRVDWLIKRLTFGRYWQRVAHAGTSRYIKQAWLAFPAHAPNVYSAIQPLPLAWFTHEGMTSLCRLAWQQHGLDVAQLANIDALFLLPHSNQWRATPALKDKLIAAVRTRLAMGHSVAVKYHPREVEDDALSLADSGASVLPKTLAAELFLPALSSDALLLGEGSTALLAAKWLKPAMHVRTLGAASGGYAQRAQSLFHKMGIPAWADEVTS